MIINVPSTEGLLYAKSAKRSTQASILKSITCFIPYFRRKNGIARINAVSENCEIDIIKVDFLTTKLLAYSGNFPNSERKTSPYMLVNCNAAPKNIEKIKNNAIL